MPGLVAGNRTNGRQYRRGNRDTGDEVVAFAVPTTGAVFDGMVDRVIVGTMYVKFVV